MMLKLGKACSLFSVVFCSERKKEQKTNKSNWPAAFKVNDEVGEWRLKEAQRRNGGRSLGCCLFDGC